MRRNPWWRPRVVRSGWRSRIGLVVGVTLVGVAIASAAGAPTAVHQAAPVPQTAAGPSRATAGPVRAEDTGPGVAHLHTGKPTTLRPHQLLLRRASGPVFDVRKLKGAVVKRERPEHEDIPRRLGQALDVDLHGAADPAPAQLLAEFGAIDASGSRTAGLGVSLE